MGLLDLPTEATRAVEPRVPQRAVTGDLGEPMRNRLMASAGGLAGDRRRLVTILVERRVADECGVFRVRLLEFVPEKNVGVVDLAVGDLEAAPRIARRLARHVCGEAARIRADLTGGPAR